jgi:ankyrin repeat protein
MAKVQCAQMHTLSMTVGYTILYLWIAVLYVNKRCTRQALVHCQQCYVKSIQVATAVLSTVRLIPQRCDRSTPLAWAAARGQQQLLLIEHLLHTVASSSGTGAAAAAATAESSSGSTALIAACAGGHTAVVTALARWGADLGAEVRR